MPNVNTALCTEVIEMVGGTMLSLDWETSTFSSRSRTEIAKLALDLCRATYDSGLAVLKTFDKFADVSMLLLFVMSTL